MANAEQTAQGLASLGRYGDTTLVHMKPEEVAGLQQLAEAKGTTLTINPETGMPEAFLGEFLESMLPTAAGAVGGAFGGPMGAAAAGALTTALQGKTEPLQIAMGGLSGYGGGQIGSALGAGGTQALAGSAAGTPEALAAQTFNAPVSNVMGANQMANVSNLPTAQINQVAANNLQHLNTGAKGRGFSPQGTPDVLGESSVENPWGIGSQNYQPSFMDTAPKTLYPIGTDTPQIADFSQGPDMNKFQTPSVPQQYIPQPPTPGILEEGIRTGANAGIDSLKASGRGIGDAFNNPTDFLERLGGKEYTDAAGNIVNEGGKGSALYGGLKLGAPVAMAGVEGYYSDMYDGMNTPLTRGGPGGPLNLSDAVRPSMTLPMYAQGGMIPSYQAGGIAGLGYGGLLQGRGDGISDSIPARIDGSQEAALSEGEFVVPARIVSEIGNGSSNAGAERLYAMMDRIEKDRERTTGQGNIAVDTNAERRLPV